MPKRSEPGAVYNCTSVKDYFRKQVAEAIDQENLKVAEETSAYLVNLLSFYSRTDQFFEYTGEGIGLRPLALVYGEALNAPTAMERAAGLRRVEQLGELLQQRGEREAQPAAGVRGRSARCETVVLDAKTSTVNSCIRIPALY